MLLLPLVAHPKMWGSLWSFHGGHSHSVQCLAVGSPRKVLNRTLGGTLKGAGIRATGQMCLGGCGGILWGSFLPAMETLVNPGNPAVGQAGRWGTPGCSPPFSCSVSSDFLLCPPTPRPLLPFFLLAVAPWQGWGAIDKLFKKIFFNFPNFSRCQEGARKTLQLQSGLEERTCSKAFPSPPPW